MIPGQSDHITLRSKKKKKWMERGGGLLCIQVHMDILKQEKITKRTHILITVGTKV